MISKHTMYEYLRTFAFELQQKQKSIFSKTDLHFQRKMFRNFKLKFNY